MAAMPLIRVALLALAALFAADIKTAIASTSVAATEPYEVNANEAQVYCHWYQRAASICCRRDHSVGHLDGMLHSDVP